ncbi:AraC family transcriptional regulator [Flagellimonas myxillae]|uniref:AraC family transcriptional regulator n=1 Tax=Flagellimonas myxillae TaxID=2942214 RepID=UPI00201EDD0A|nr:AraC family transcriptional regulator [Muricauda myxillae]MCL6265163.1 AraC family transcriptional regulator [Muricauda myxillae]
MKPQLVDRTNRLNRTLSEQLHSFPYFLKVWHYHPEIELVAVKKSTGVIFLGNDMERFQPGDIFLIGSNVPHMLLNDPKYFKPSSKLKAESQVIHFDKALLESDIFKFPEASEMVSFLDDARYTIKFDSAIHGVVEKKVRKMFEVGNFEKIILLLQLMIFLGTDAKYKVISKGDVAKTSMQAGTSHNMDKVYDYIYCNFRESVELDKLVDIACMNKSSFCRYFKRMNNKTVSRFVNELRIGYACQLLQENKFSITTICYESGFNNISNFNRQFRNIMDLSPSDYVKKLNFGK